DCAHELFAVTARKKMPASVGRTLHRAAAELLEGDKKEMLSAPWCIAEHWAAGGDSGRALSVIRTCAQEALRVGRPQDSLELLSRAIDLAVSPNDREEILLDTVRASLA